MPDKNDKKRKAPISYRPPKELREEFDARVQNSGLSTNAFRTEAVFGKGRHRPVELEKLAVILAKAAQISDQLHEISLAGSDDSALAIESAFIHFRSVMRTGPSLTVIVGECHTRDCSFQLLWSPSIQTPDFSSVSLSARTALR